jgi:small subunit ribosomal protein S8
MSMTDPIADLLTRVRNGAAARKEYVDCPWSTMKERVAKVMVARVPARAQHVEVGEKKKDLRVWLATTARSARRFAACAASAGRGPYLRRSEEMPSLRAGMGINIVSTPVGVLVDREAARRNVGGEIICAVW